LLLLLPSSGICFGIAPPSGYINVKSQEAPIRIRFNRRSTEERGNGNGAARLTRALKDIVVPTAVPARGRIVMRRGPEAPASDCLGDGDSGASCSSSSLAIRRNSSGSRGDSYLLLLLLPPLLRFLGFERGRDSAAATSSRRGVPSRDDELRCSRRSASLSRSVRVGVTRCAGDDRRSESTLVSATGRPSLLAAVLEVLRGSGGVESSCMTD
jgi:hypothetical protein